MRRTSPGMARTLAKDRKRSWRGSAMKRETANKAKSTADKLGMRSKDSRGLEKLIPNLSM